MNNYKWMLNIIIYSWIKILNIINRIIIIII